MRKKEKNLNNNNMKKLSKLVLLDVRYSPDTRVVTAIYNISDDDDSAVIAGKSATKTITEQEADSMTLLELEDLGLDIAEDDAKTKYGKDK